MDYFAELSTSSPADYPICWPISEVTRCPTMSPLFGAERT
jgi:hypothetical protein